ncbi:hypothetical protein PBY51_020502 [Eleginops maclovinus]|uniref:Uncharacterized protein n=3 Tax=Eleginops maclovinus TaxID=56733 RepID=A0AAN7XSU8_ELEMC|nr:hypothetical protein PBY51_020502 [Eleginops maclovinus]
MGNTSWRERAERAETEASLRRLLPTLDTLLQQLDRVTMATEDLYHIECRLELTQRERRQRGRERGGQGGKSEAGQRGKGEDSAGWRKSGKEKHKGSKKGKKKDKSELLKDSGNTATKKTPVAAPAPFLKPRPSSAAAHTPAPPASAKASVSAPPPTPVADKPASDTSPPPVSSGITPPSHIPQPKTPSAPPCTPAPTPSMPSTPAPTPSRLDWEPPSSSLFNHPAHTTTIPTRKRKRKPPPLKNKVHPNLDRQGPGHTKT